MAARVRERLAENKLATQNVVVEVFNLSKPRQLDIMKKIYIKLRFQTGLQLWRT